MRHEGLFLERIPAAIWIVLAWAIAVLPNLSVRSFIWEEGTNAELARDILAGGDVLEPAIYGVRWVEKPPLLPWLVAAAARLTGGVDEWSARLVPMLAVLLTALLVQRLTRRYASASASLFAAAAFMFCPLLLRKLTVSEPDTIVTFLSFAAFLVWWRGEETGRAVGWRWLACGVLLAILAMAKGPQPVGFFALGVGSYFIARRRLSALPGLLCCLALPAAATAAWVVAVYRAGDLPIWLRYMRVDIPLDLLDYLRERVRFGAGLPLDLLPSTIVLPSLLISWWRRGRVSARIAVVEPAALYAGLCTLALLVWPGARTRYAMPAAPALAVLGGIAFDAVRYRARVAARVAGAMAAALFAYQVALVTVVIPLFAEQFGATRQAGAVLDRAIGAAPAPVFAIGGPHSNEMFYVTRPIRVIDPSTAAITAPVWLLAPSAQVSRLEQRRPDLATHIVVATSAGPGLVAARLERRCDP